MIQLKVVAVSTNANSFGLRNMVLIGSNGQGWQAAANHLNVKPVDTLLQVPEWQDIPTFLTMQSFEIPSQLADPPANLVEEIFGASVSVP